MLLLTLPLMFNFQEGLSDVFYSLLWILIVFSPILFIASIFLVILYHLIYILRPGLFRRKQIIPFVLLYLTSSTIFLFIYWTFLFGNINWLAQGDLFKNTNQYLTKQELYFLFIYLVLTIVLYGQKVKRTEIDLNQNKTKVN